jgi:hypothetical protein
VECDKYHSHFAAKRLTLPPLLLSVKICGALPSSGDRKARWCYAIVCVLVLATLCSPATRQSSDKPHPSSAKADQQKGRAEQAGSQTAAEPGGAPPVDPAEFVGVETCRSCHEQEGKTYDKGPHSKLTSAKAKGPQWQGCEACHGPGREHAESGDPASIIRFAALTREEASRRCLRCHESGREHAKLHHSQNMNGKGGCLDCHSIHGASIRSEAL